MSRGVAPRRALLVLAAVTALAPAASARAARWDVSLGGSLAADVRCQSG